MDDVLQAAIEDVMTTTVYANSLSPNGLVSWRRGDLLAPVFPLESWHCARPVGQCHT